MKASEARELGLHGSEEKLLQLKTELAKERAVLASGTRPENPGKIRSLRRDIARLLTIINEKKKAGIAVEKEKSSGKAERAKDEKVAVKKTVAEKSKIEKPVKNEKKNLKSKKGE